MIPRPLRLVASQIIKDKVDRYFEECEENGKAAVFSGISYHLGISRLALGQWLNQKDHDQPTDRAKELLSYVKSACRRLEMEYEERLISNKGNVAGIKLSLTNNFSWRDKTDLDISTPKAAPELTPGQRQDLHEAMRMVQIAKVKRQQAEQPNDKAA
jgi:hypothetical protein